MRARLRACMRMYAQRGLGQDVAQPAYAAVIGLVQIEGRAKEQCKGGSVQGRSYALSSWSSSACRQVEWQDVLRDADHRKAGQQHAASVLLVYRRKSATGLLKRPKPPGI